MDILSNKIGEPNIIDSKNMPEQVEKADETNGKSKFIRLCSESSDSRLVFSEDLNFGDSNMCMYNECENDNYYGEDIEPADTKYEYKEPDENFISIDDLKVRPFLFNMIKNIADEAKKSEDSINQQKKTAKIEEVILIEDDDSDHDITEQLNSTDLEQNKQTFECFLCKKTVASSYNLRRHMMIHTGERPFGCDICSKRFREFSDLKKHRRVHNNEKDFKCMVCHQNTPSITNATKCNPCTLKENKIRVKYDKFICDEIPLLEGSQKKAFVCPLCDRIFGSRHNLKRHFMIHTGEKPYRCDVCDKWFREVSTLKKHMITHSRIKLFQCNICDKEYNDFGAYNRHKVVHDDKSDILKKRSHLDNLKNDGDYLFECIDCRKQFNNASTYKEHLKLHSREFSFQCFICKQMFRTKEKLSSHFVTHNDETDDE